MKKLLLLIFFSLFWSKSSFADQELKYPLTTDDLIKMF